MELGHALFFFLLNCAGAYCQQQEHKNPNTKTHGIGLQPLFLMECAIVRVPSARILKSKYVQNTNTDGNGSRPLFLMKLHY